MATPRQGNRSDAESRGRGPATDAPPATVEEALERAGRHARNSAAEALAGARALLDALSLATGSRPAAERSALGLAAHALDALGDLLAGGDGGGADSLLAAVADALDAEIARWEARAGDDPEARAVMRAFLGLKEVLWELGIRRGSEAAAPPGARPPRRPGRSPSRPSRRVKRVPVEG